jgi:glucose/arabinose dehydrogenase
VKEKKTIIPEPGVSCLGPLLRQRRPSNASQLNHGLDLSDDGTTLYVSTVEYADRYTYDAATATVSNRTRLVTGMSHATGGHSTRTLLLSRKYPDLLLISRGSGPTSTRSRRTSRPASPKSAPSTSPRPLWPRMAGSPTGTPPRAPWWAGVSATAWAWASTR